LSYRFDAAIRGANATILLEGVGHHGADAAIPRSPR
jgi:hypothetical protein